MSCLNPAEAALASLVHDLRQPLGNIEMSVWCLRTLAESADPRIREQIAIIERQIERAEEMLAVAAADLSHERTRRGEALAMTR